MLPSVFIYGNSSSETMFFLILLFFSAYFSIIPIILSFKLKSSLDFHFTSYCSKAYYLILCKVWKFEEEFSLSKITCLKGFFFNDELLFLSSPEEDFSLDFDFDWEIRDLSEMFFIDDFLFTFIIFIFTLLLKLIK